MKKLLVLVLSLLIWGCNYSYQNNKEEFLNEDSITIIEPEYLMEMELLDSTFLLEEKKVAVQVELDVNLKSNEVIDSIKKDSIEEKNDLIKKDSIEKEDTLKRRRYKRIISIKADTTSVLPELKKNREIINKQQELLDSLLNKK